MYILVLHLWSSGGERRCEQHHIQRHIIVACCSRVFRPHALTSSACHGRGVQKGLFAAQDSACLAALPLQSAHFAACACGGATGAGRPMLLLLPRDILGHLFAGHLRLRDVALIARLNYEHFTLVYTREDLWDALIDGQWHWRRALDELPPTVALAAREYFAFDMHQRRRIGRTALLGVRYCAPLYLVRVVHVLAATERPVVRHEPTLAGVRVGRLLNRLWQALVFHLPFLGMAEQHYAFNTLSAAQRARLQIWSRALVDRTASSLCPIRRL